MRGLQALAAVENIQAGRHGCDSGQRARLCLHFRFYHFNPTRDDGRLIFLVERILMRMPCLSMKLLRNPGPFESTWYLLIVGIRRQRRLSIAESRTGPGDALPAILREC
jgi:hypothetical protein